MLIICDGFILNFENVIFVEIYSENDVNKLIFHLIGGLSKEVIFSTLQKVKNSVRRIEQAFQVEDRLVNIGEWHC